MQRAVRCDQDGRVGCADSNWPDSPVVTVVAARDHGVVNHRLREDLPASTTGVDIAGRRRSSATLPGYHQGRPPRNKGLQYPPDPPTVEEIIAVMRAAGDDSGGLRLRGLLSCCGAPAHGSAKRSRWPRATSTRTVERSWSVMARAASAAGPGWTGGAG